MIHQSLSPFSFRLFCMIYFWTRLLQASHSFIVTGGGTVLRPYGRVRHDFGTESTSTQPTTSFANSLVFQHSAVHIQGYDEAFEIVDKCAETGELSPALDEAVRFLEVNSYRIYPATDPTHIEELWQAAQGSWKLIASTGSYKCRQFHPTPWFLPFPFAMIDGTHFGNGIGLDERHIGLAFLHHAHFHAPHRRLTVTHPDMYVMGHPVSFPDFMRPAVLKVVEGPGDHEDQKSDTPSPAMATPMKDSKKTKDVPTFVLVGASEKTLIARGNQSGGLALWARLPQDIRSVAYKKYPSSPTPQQSYQLLPH